jgi:hypothetical protein
MGFRYVFDIFELRDHYGDVGCHLLVQDAPGFIQTTYEFDTFVGILWYLYINV